ncbi:hypothetical protein [Methylophilus medardicus]|uniref:Porin n=1 Tax=Methylophilus medardicus TaxID=2588534 RepID=A0A5B8CUY1_9PROT|nr:hypothetical protein [Methylophilus medardicus]QDC45108.1 hypothetical protein FIU01_11645 [Methylophilus medardicus]QDC50115.1 hypothetical protein FIU00_11645 [Methylophilus medardicus]QDC53820.1 hypothetical protein FIT99_11645 [Methylophilus medardicus]
MLSTFIRVTLSVISLCVLCKSVMADEVDPFWQGFHVGGYSSIDARLPRTETATLKLNEVSMIVTWDKGTRLKFFSELELENPMVYDHHDGFNTKQSYVDLERFYFDYNLNEKTNIRLGRFLTPVGRWNQLHAPPLVWTASRPLVTSRLFPSGLNGAMLFGSLPIKHMDMEYQIYAEALKDQHQDGDEIIHRQVKGARLAFNNILGLSSNNAGLNTLGLNVMSYQKDFSGSSTYHLYGLDFLLELNRWEFSGEVYERKTSGGGDGGSGAYLQGAYALGHEWYSIVRLETLHEVDRKNADRWVLGMTKRVKPNQLLKFEFIGGSGEYEDVPRGFVTSFAVMF